MTVAYYSNVRIDVVPSERSVSEVAHVVARIPAMADSISVILK